MGFIDLHCHSIYSDGTCTPDELITEAKNLGLSALAITDHDTTEGHRNITISTKDIEIIPGVEYTARIKNEYIDILGLYIDPSHPSGNKLQNKIKEIKTAYLARCIPEVLKKHNIDKREWEQFMIDNNFGFHKVAFSTFLVHQGFGSNMQAANIKVFHQGLYPFLQEESISYKEAIETIHESGGIAIWAHPFCVPDLDFRTNDNVLDILETLKGYGIDGIEVYHGQQTMEQAEFLKREAKNSNLLISGGSDYHGKNKSNVYMGKMCGDFMFDEIHLDKIKKYIHNKGKEL